MPEQVAPKTVMQMNSNNNAHVQLLRKVQSDLVDLFHGIQLEGINPEELTNQIVRIVDEIEKHNPTYELNSRINQG